MASDDDWTSSTSVLDFPAAGRLLGTLLVDEPSVGAPPSALSRIGQYRLVGTIGRGGGGEVFLATREGSDERLALKSLNRSLGDQAASDRAWRELGLLTDLRLSGTPAVLDSGIHDGRMYFVTAHVEGLTLADHCARHNLDRRQRVDLLIKVAMALQELHEHGVIHRDIKPDNLVINSEGQPIIVDFGIASLIAGSVQETLTMEGSPIGTPAYMAPEQARGEKSQVSTRSDVYGLGATACLVLTGQTPHESGGSLLETIAQVGNQAPRDPCTLDPSLPASLARIVARAISFDPADRYPSAAALAEDLRRWLRNEPIEWQKPGLSKRLKLNWRRDRRGFLAKSLVAALIAISLTAGAFGFSQWQLAEERKELAAREQKNSKIWEEHARKMDTWRLEVLERAKRLKERRVKQIERVQRAQAEGDFFGATIVLLNYAEEIEAEELDNQEVVTNFVAMLNGVIDAAKAKQNSTTEPAAK